MPSQRPHGGTVTLFLLLSCCGLCPAVEPIPSPAPAATLEPAPNPGASTIYVGPANPATDYSGVDNSNPTASLRALPVNPGDAGTDASIHRKFYTISASLREIYDSNVNTSNINKQVSYETDLSPSILVDFPSTTGDFSARYTLGLDYYTYGPSNNGDGANTNDQDSLEVTHEVVAQFSHSFSEIYQLSLAEEFRDFTEPSIMESTGTNFQDGPYISNSLTGSFGAQLSPLFSSTTSIANTVIRYENSTVGDLQNNVETTGTQSIGYALLPKITISLGAEIDNTSYDTADRGYTNYTLFAGTSWQALPSLSISARAGASYAETSQDSEDSLSPYAAMTVNWSLGARSLLTFDYSHELTPSDEQGSNGQESDRFSTAFSYQITPRLTSHLNGILTLATVPQDLSTDNAPVTNDGSAYYENSYEVDLGFNYQYTSIVGFDWGLTFSGVDSNISNNTYNRDEAYIGVRGTY